MHEKLTMRGILSGAVLFALLLSAITPGMVFAEGEAPEVIPPEANPPVTHEAVAEMVNLLDESEMVIATDDGEVVPLASQSAIEILCEADPWFYGALCVGGVCKGLGAGEDGYANLEDAVQAWDDMKGYGYIYIEGGQTLHERTTISINGANAGYATLKGIRWDDTGGSRPVLEGGLDVSNMPAGFLLQGLNFDVYDEFYDIKFHNNKGLIKFVDVEVKGIIDADLSIEFHTGAIELTNVALHDNTTGIVIKNCGTTSTCVNTGTIKITNSTFAHNGMDTSGLRIESAGVITLNGVTASNNVGNGAYITSYNSLIIKNSSFSNNTYTGMVNNLGYGLLVTPNSKGNILLENVKLTENALSGAWLHTTTGSITLKKVQAIGNGTTIYLGNRHFGVEIGDSSLVDLAKAGATTVTISDSVFLDNYRTNLLVNARAAITLINVTALGSETGSGADLSNQFALTTAPITVTNSVFNENKNKGLFIQSKGTITLNTISAAFNQSTVEPGIVLDNTFGSAGLNILSTYGVNSIHNAYPVAGRAGLKIDSNGNVSINALEVYDHGSFGVTVTTKGSITWRGGGAWNNNNQSDSYYWGARLDNQAGVIKPVTILNAWFDDNNFGHGLLIESSGQVTLTNINANRNGIGGLIVLTSSGVSILRTLAAGYNTFNGNKGGDGIFFNAGKNVLLSRVQANGNRGAGVKIYSNGMVTVNGAATQPAMFNNNEGHDGSNFGAYAGLHIANAKNGVSLANIQANSNNGAGAYINTNGALTLGGVLNEFSENSQSTIYQYQEYGLYVYWANGNVTLSNVLVDGNYGGGIYIYTESSGNVTLNNTIAGMNSQITNSKGIFGADTTYSLYISSWGAVSISRLNVDNNLYQGAKIQNVDALTSKPVSIAYSSFNNNYYFGLDVKTAGKITLNRVTASDNVDGNGAELDNDELFRPTQVYMPVIVGNSTFSNNKNDGLYLYSARTVTLTNVTANNTSNAYGVYIQNEKDPSSPYPVFVLGKNQFNANFSGGLYIVSYGAVTISGVEAGNNTSRGIEISTRKAVSITNSTVYNTALGSGIKVYITGTDPLANVTLNNVSSMGNQSQGLYISASAGKVKLYNSTFISNTGYGFSIDVLVAPVYPSLTSLYFFMSNVNYYGNNWGFAPYQVY